MLPLLITVLATAYVVVPELLTRFVIGLRLLRKVSTSTRSEEIVRAAFWAVVPLLIAWLLRNVGPLKVPPGIGLATQKTFSGLYSDKFFEASPTEFQKANADSLRERQTLEDRA